MSKTKKGTGHNKGETHTVNIGEVTVFFTVNLKNGKPFEIFAKEGSGHQGELDGLCILASIAMKHGCPVALIVDKMRYRKYAPEGGPGQPCSLSDAMGRVLGSYLPKEEDDE